MQGYYGVYLRTYFPAEFIIGYLNAAKSIDDIIKGDTLARTLNISYLNDPEVRKRKADIINTLSLREKHITADDLPFYNDYITIKNPEFGKSKGLYTLDKEHYAIYKGVGSVKMLNNTVAEELYELAQKPEYKNVVNLSEGEKLGLFYQLVKDMILNTCLKINQLKILIEIDFFKAFGKNQTLLNIIAHISSLLNGLKFKGVKLESKQFKKADIPFLPLNKEMFEKYIVEEKEKLFYVNLDGYFLEYFQTFENVSLPLLEQLKLEEEHVGSYLLHETESGTPIYAVSEFKMYGATPYMKLLNLSTNESFRCSVGNKKNFSIAKFEEGSFIENCSFDRVDKKTKVGDHWEFTGEQKTLLMGWSLLKAA